MNNLLNMRFRMLIIVAVLSLAVLAGVLLVYVDPSGNSLSFGPSEKVCQLTGKEDWDTQENIAARTGADLKFGFTGTDGGYPVEYNAGNHPNGMALFFGDSRFHPHRGDDKNPELVPDDAIGWVSTQTPPTKDNCLGVMTINARSPRVRPAIKQSLFNTPTGGVTSNGFLYGFFWTDHCLHDQDAKCPDSSDFGSLNKWGHGVLARYEDGGRIEDEDSETFAHPVPMPKGFVLSTAVDSEVAVGLPEEQRLGIYVFGVPRFRASVPYLAYAPPGKIADPSAWMFFIGRKPDGQPSWTSRQVWESRLQAHLPGPADLFEASGLCDRSVGDFSVTWNRALHVWLLMYNRCNPSDEGGPSNRGGHVVVVRVAAAPWGPWSDESILLDPNRDSPWCHLLWQVPSVKFCGKLRIKVETSEKNIASLNDEINDATGVLKINLQAQLERALKQLTREKEALADCEKAPQRSPPPPGGVVRCDDHHKDEWRDDAERAGNQNGEFYAPYVMERYTTPERTSLPYRRRATIYWLVSTWNPYQVVVMKTTLTIDESATTVRVVRDLRSVFGGK